MTPHAPPGAFAAPAAPADPSAAAPVLPPRRSSPLLYLVLVAGCVTMADLLLKRGALSSHPATADSNSLNLLTNFASPYTLIGILFHIAGLGAWMLTLRRVPLTLAYCFTAVQQATIALGAWLWLGEQITPLRWAGIACVFTGVLILVPAIVAADALAPSPRSPQ